MSLVSRYRSKVRLVLSLGQRDTNVTQRDCHVTQRDRLQKCHVAINTDK